MPEFTEALGRFLNNSDDRGDFELLLIEVQKVLKSMFKQLFNVYYTREVEMDDLVTDAWLRFKRKLDDRNFDFVDKLKSKFEENKSRKAVEPLLAKIAKSILIDQLRREGRHRERGEVNAPDYMELADQRKCSSLEEVCVAAERLLSDCKDPKTRHIVLLGLRGYSKDEIANELQVANRTIERKLAKLFHIYTQTEDKPPVVNPQSSEYHTGDTTAVLQEFREGLQE